jgi:hypothetical protein
MGAISGAFAGAVAMTAATLVYLLTLPSVALLGLGAGVGAMIGTLSLPVLAWAFLRHVPLRVAIVGTGIGTAVGGAAGLLLGASAVNPYVPFSLFLAPFPQCAVGGVLGATLAAGGAHAYYRRQARISAHAG